VTDPRTMIARQIGELAIVNAEQSALIADLRAQVAAMKAQIEAAQAPPPDGAAEMLLSR
jgi:hypothetical protein